jgi:hypothetical protein
MKALLVLVAMASVAHANEIATFPMTRIDGPSGGRPSEVRYVPRLGQLWRYGTRVFLYDGAWWEIIATIDAGSGMGGKFTEVEGEQVRIDVVGRGVQIAFDVTASGKRRLCHGRGAGDDPDVPHPTTCDDWEQVTVSVVCWRNVDKPQCLFE